jgi:nucleoside-diphosphate-sugar epimerase
MKTRDTAVLVTGGLRRLATGEAAVIDGRGEQSMDFVHVSDVARSVGLAEGLASVVQHLKLTGELS